MAGGLGDAVSFDDFITWMPAPKPRWCGYTECPSPGLSPWTCPKVRVSHICSRRRRNGAIPGFHGTSRHRSPRISSRRSRPLQRPLRLGINVVGSGALSRPVLPRRRCFRQLHLLRMHGGARVQRPVPGMEYPGNSATQGWFPEEVLYFIEGEAITFAPPARGLVNWSISRETLTEDRIQEVLCGWAGGMLKSSEIEALWETWKPMWRQGSWVVFPIQEEHHDGISRIRLEINRTRTVHYERLFLGAVRLDPR